MPNQSNGYGLRMKQLPKPEYRLMKALQLRYNLSDISELFGVALRLMAEVELYQSPTGQVWIQQVINSYRSLSEAERVYDPPLQTGQITTNKAQLF